MLNSPSPDALLLCWTSRTAPRCNEVTVNRIAFEEQERRIGVECFDIDDVPIGKGKDLLHRSRAGHELLCKDR